MASDGNSGDGSRFVRLVNALDHAIVWEFDDTLQRYTFVSEHAKLVLGFAAEDWLHDSQRFERCIVPEDLPNFLALIAKLRSGEANDLRTEHRCLNADGATVWVHTGVHREHEGGNTIFRGVTVDINNVKQAEERERKARTVAEDTARSLEEILAVVSHDVRTPLNAIVLGIGLLRQQAPGATRVVDAIERSANRLTRLVDDLIDMASIRARRLEIAQTEASTDTLLNDAVAGASADAAAKGVVLALLSSPSLTVRCDPRRIAQVLNNLVQNAVKFTAPGGTVEVYCTVDAHELTFSVRDIGAGIAADSVGSIFDRHWQEPATASQGRGLGLFIAKGIVEAHAGRIWVDSTLGQGSTFSFTLPRG
jgi:PAS domain S-box-containing protein